MQRTASSTSDRTIGDGNSNANAHNNDGSLAHTNTAVDGPKREKVDDKEQLADGGEKGEKDDRDGPASPVGFWDKRLKKMRLHVLGLWARTSKLGSLAIVRKC